MLTMLRQPLRQSLSIVGLLLGLMMAVSVQAAVYTLPANGDNVIGSDDVATSGVGDSLSTFARRHDVGYYAILEANPAVDPLRLPSGIRLFVPGQFILPDAPREGVVINLAELRLYYYPPNSNTVVTYPIGIGRIGQGWQTPTGVLPISEKVKDPAWHVPPSVIADMAKRGQAIPDVIPAGPDNPLGAYMMRLGETSFLIHGTNRPDSVGRRTSAGCVHLYPEDIEQLFNSVPLGTQVTIVNQPIKAGWLKGKLYFEAHSPLLEQKAEYAGRYDDLSKTILQNATVSRAADVDLSKVRLLVQKQTGVPGVVGLTASQTKPVTTTPPATTTTM